MLPAVSGNHLISVSFNWNDQIHYLTFQPHNRGHRYCMYKGKIFACMLFLKFVLQTKKVSLSKHDLYFIMKYMNEITACH